MKIVHAWIPSHFTEWYAVERGGDYLRIVNVCPCCGDEKAIIKARSKMQDWEWENLPSELIRLGYERVGLPF